MDYLTVFDFSVYSALKHFGTPSVVGIILLSYYVEVSRQTCV